MVDVVVQDENEAIQQKHTIGSFLGNIGSRIEYSLEPAFEGTDDAIAQIGEVSMPERAKLRQQRDSGEEQMLSLDVLF